MRYVSSEHLNKNELFKTHKATYLTIFSDLIHFYRSSAVVKSSVQDTFFTASKTSLTLEPAEKAQLCSNDSVMRLLLNQTSDKAFFAEGSLVLCVAR